jgi:hypothetical protein
MCFDTDPKCIFTPDRDTRPSSDEPGGVPVVLVVESRSREQISALSRTDSADLAKVSEVSETDQIQI